MSRAPAPAPPACKRRWQPCDRRRRAPPGDAPRRYLAPAETLAANVSGGMSKRTQSIALATTLLSGASALIGAPPAGALPFSPCASSPGFTCATVPVPLDRHGTAPGTLSLSVERKL